MIGKTIAQYRILDRLGEGGMGVVYLAEDTSLHRTVALKFLPPDSVVTAAERSRLIREARAAASLLHPGICPVYEIGNVDGHAFIAMAHLEGQNLAERLAGGPLTPSTALSVACQVGEALAAAHAKGIVHRDVKPANVMLTEGDRAVLMDFGLATMTGASRLTQAGTTLGTLAYTAPEQIQAGEADERSDVWALGVMLQEMITGEHPFRGDYQGALIYAILHGEPRPLPPPGPEIPAGLEEIRDRALAKDPQRRYQRVADLVADLRAVMDDPAFRPQPTGRVSAESRGERRPARRPGGRLVMAGAAVVILAVAIGIGIDLLRGGTGDLIDSLGVLPLENLSGDPANDVWATGVTEQLSASIGTVSALKVISDQTMKQFQESSDTLPDIGRKVGARGLVAGSVQVIDDEIQVLVKLYDAAEDRLIWSNTYRQPLREVQQVQGRIATDIAGQLDAPVTPAERSQLTVTSQIDPEAYKSVLIGWNEVAQLDPESVRDAIAAFRKAIDIDPTYAEAYAGLAGAHYWRAIAGYGSPHEEFPLSRAAASKAIAMDERNAHGHAELANVLLSYDWDWDGAGREFRRALELNPSNATFHADIAGFLTAMRQQDEAVAEARRAVELDPLTGYWRIMLAWTLFYNDRAHEAIDVLETTLRLYPELAGWAYNHLALSHLKLGQGEAACAAYDSALVHSPDEPVLIAGSAHVYGRFGRTADARRMIAELESKQAEGYVDPWCFAFAYDGLGDIDRAATWLETCHEERSPSIWGMNFEVWTDEFKADPRYQAVLAKMNYPAP
jgi:TolB-like protein/Tfp pilus assembly protein PilF/predicted Ser/Thr protein kinase